MRSGISFLDDHINSRYGTLRGLIRLAFNKLKMHSGQYRRLEHINWPQAQRLVYVCQGNICRSAFAHHLGLKTLPSIKHASLGISTKTGINADPVAARVAASFDVDLQSHQATDLADFAIMDGDVFFLMEDRHLAAVESALRATDKETQIVLLGLWSAPKFPLLYDPFRLSEGYFQTCFRRIYSALDNIDQERRRHLAQQG